MSADLSILLTGSCIACSCALLGCFLILRRMALVGDAISHAVLPGIVIAFLMTGSRSSPVMILGAAALGLMTTFIIEGLHQKARLQTDASIGITFTFLFAIGVVMLSVWAGKVDLDQDCVLYGELAYVPLDLWVTASGTVLVPRALIITSVLLVIILIWITSCFRPLMTTAFDPVFASSLGISVSLWHYLLMGAVSVTTVVSFELVGAILVVALLVAPAVTAYLLTDNFRLMLVIACTTGVISVVSGYYLAFALDASIAGAIASTNGILFTLAFVLSPAHGLIRRRKKTSMIH